jgi:hypothetical protein
MGSDTPKDTAEDTAKKPSPNAVPGKALEASEPKAKDSAKDEKKESPPPRDVAKESALEEKKEIAKTEAEDKASRLPLYRRNDVRRLVTWILDGHDEIRPERNPETGDYYYPGADFGGGNISALLAELESYKILEKTMIDTVPICPGCQHSNFHVTYVCPYSQHTTLEHGTMLEHYACGNADFESNYRSGLGGLICPKCRRPLKVVGTDYRKLERAYRCNGCGKFFGTPKLNLPCRVCGRKNEEEDLTMAPVYGYRINNQLRSELIANCSLNANIIAFFEKSGFKVTSPIKMPGLSGVEYTFDLGAKKDDEQIVLDMVSAEIEVGSQDVIAFFGKVYDAKPSKALLVAFPKLNREALRLGAMYGVDVVGAETPDEIISKLTTVFGTVTPSGRASTGGVGEPTRLLGGTSTKPLVEQKTAPFVEQAIKAVEQVMERDNERRETTRGDEKTMPAKIPEEPSKGDDAMRRAHERIEQPASSTRSEETESSTDVALRKARERMNQLMKEADRIST